MVQEKKKGKKNKGEEMGNSTIFLKKKGEKSKAKKREERVGKEKAPAVRPGAGWEPGAGEGFTWARRRIADLQRGEAGPGRAGPIRPRCGLTAGPGRIKAASGRARLRGDPARDGGSGVGRPGCALPGGAARGAGGPPSSQRSAVETGERERSG